MAEIINRLSALKINKLNTAGYFVDGGGLVLQISKTGSKSWLFKFDYQGKRHEMGLGSLATVNLKDAREKARLCRLKLLDGINPLLEKKQAFRSIAQQSARMLTFEECANSYIKAHESSWKNPKHLQQWENTIKTYANPVIGKLNASDIDTSHIRKILDSIWKTKTETAVRLRGRIETILDWAKVAGYRDGENPARWNGHLDQMLPAPNKIKKVKHLPSLPWTEISNFMNTIREDKVQASKAVALAILTATRSNEIRFAKWSEFDLEQSIWIIPAERMKAGKEHRIPLSKQVIALLNTLDKEGEFIFKGRKEGTPISDMTLTAVIRRMDQAIKDSGGAGLVDANGETITMHGFRSTFRDWCAESSEFPREVAEHALAHKLPDKIEQAYQRGDMLQKRALLMQSWADFCDKT